MTFRDFISYLSLLYSQIHCFFLRVKVTRKSQDEFDELGAKLDAGRGHHGGEGF